MGNLDKRQENAFKEGFLYNKKRGTAFVFNETAVDQFFQKNKLSHMIRAHEMKPLGLHFMFDGKVITVFSCSYYTGSTNIAAIIYVENGIISPVQVLTMEDPKTPGASNARKQRKYT